MSENWNGRFAPSPTGDLHLGNLRTALVAWLTARAKTATFVMRMEDLDAAVSRRAFAESQLRDLAALGLDWDGPVAHQSDRHEHYVAALANLQSKDLVYECFCTRKEIQAASQAPHGPLLDGRYPGTCRDLDSTARSQLSVNRPPALRLRTGVDSGSVTDLVAGHHEFPIDDLVLVRNDGTWAYNLAVVVDDAEQGVGTVVRANDLLSSSPRQLYLADLLGLPSVQYAHIPLVINASGQRLAKRDGAVTLSDRIRLGESPCDVLNRLARSLGVLRGDQSVKTAAELVSTFSLAAIPPTPVVLV